MLEDILRTVDPATILIKEDSPRHRKDLGEIQKLVESIRKYGQIQPIVVTRDMVLVAGGRRLAACLVGGFQAKICFSDELDPLILRELELEENLQRKELTPAEEAFAVQDLIELKQKRYGKPTQGKEGGYTLDNAAKLIGKSKGYVIEAIQIAEAVKAFPELGKCGTKSEIKTAVKGLERVAQNMNALIKHEETVKTTKMFTLFNTDAIAHMKDMADSSIDLLFTDPPYGIDIDKQAIALGGHTGGDLTTVGFKYEDSVENALRLYQVLATESARFCKPTAHALIFCGPTHFWTLKNMFNTAGWICSERPVIWIKQGSGQNNNPDAWFSSSYEMLLFARKVNSKLVLWGKPDWIQCNIVTPTERVHQAEKPIPLLKELISRVCLPGSYLYDPFMGSGSIIEAALDMKLLVIGCEIDVKSYATGLARLVKWQERQ